MNRVSKPSSAPPAVFRTPRAVLSVVVTFVAGTVSASPPISPIATPSFSLDATSPTITGSPRSAADILDAPGPVALFTAGALGLDPALDDIDALSTDVDAPVGPVAFLFSVDRATIGLAVPYAPLVAAGVPYNVTDQAARGQAAGDLFQSTDLFTLGLSPPRLIDVDNNVMAINQFDEGGNSFDLEPNVSGDDYTTQTLDDVDAAGHDASGSRSGGPVGCYFSLTSGSVSFPGAQNAHGANIYYNPDPGVSTSGLYADATSTQGLGLLAGDDIDAMVVFDEAGSPGLFGPGDRVLFSLTPGSPTLAIAGGAPGAAAYILLKKHGMAITVAAMAT
ncbi:MAG: hypothetical protein GY778_01065, partial [bacterium]|nr:hypothetical protein [bacterium]